MQPIDDSPAVERTIVRKMKRDKERDGTQAPRVIRREQAIRQNRADKYRRRASR